MRKLINVLFIITILALGIARPGLAQNLSKDVTFMQLYGGEFQLTGPFDSNSQTFGLPADWQLSGPAELTLEMTVSLNTFVVNATDAVSSGGILTIQFNRHIVASLPIAQAGDISFSVTIPQADLVSPRADGRMELSFTLDSGISCDVNQKVTIFIHPNSRLALPHEDKLPDVSLLRFPYPLYQDTIFPESALVVIPDQPTAGDLQSALTVSAGLANMSNEALLLDMVTVGQLTPEQRNTNNLILIGDAAAMPLLAELKLPLAPVNKAFVLSNEDDGVVVMLNSVWNRTKVILVVTGNTEAGIIKAAQAVSTGILQPYTSSNLAIVEAIAPQVTPISIPVNQTLTDLGYGSDTIARAISSSSGFTTTFSYKFYLPPGEVPAEGAYFELAFGHSSLINYDRSGAVVLLNSQPIGSVRPSDEYAANSINKIKIALPASAVLSGFNKLDVQVSLYPRDNCSLQSVKGLWFAVWPDSNFYLPLIPAIINPTAALDLSAYPAPYVFNSALDKTAFVLQRGNFETWNAAFKIAGYIGNKANGTVTTLKVYYGDDVPEAERPNYDFIVIGQADQMPLVTEINANLPAPFANQVAASNDLSVVYRIPANASQGYLQLLQSPWNANNIIIGALGNTAQGVAWASNVLIDSILRSKLSGNFAVVNDTQVVTTDTRVSVLAPSATLPDGTMTQPNALVPAQIDLTVPPAERPAWVYQGMLVAAGAVIFIILFVIITTWLKNRKRGH